MRWRRRMHGKRYRIENRMEEGRKTSKPTYFYRKLKIMMKNQEFHLFDLKSFKKNFTIEWHSSFLLQLNLELNVQVKSEYNRKAHWKVLGEKSSLEWLNRKIQAIASVHFPNEFSLFYLHWWSCDKCVKVDWPQTKCCWQFFQLFNFLSLFICTASNAMCILWTKFNKKIGLSMKRSYNQSTVSLFDANSLAKSQ